MSVQCMIKSNYYSLTTTIMESRPGMCLTLLESRVFTTFAGLAMVLLTVAGMVVGMGMSPIHMWLIMASVCIVWLSFCRCITWQRKTTQRLRTDEMANRHAAIGTISNGVRVNNIETSAAMSSPREMNDHMLMMLMRDTPPSYDVVNAGLEQQPPSYSSVVAKLDPQDGVVVVSIVEGESPPPYNSNNLEIQAGGAHNEEPTSQPSHEYICVTSAGKPTTDTTVRIK